MIEFAWNNYLRVVVLLFVVKSNLRMKVCIHPATILTTLKQSIDNHLSNLKNMRQYTTRVQNYAYL